MKKTWYSVIFAIFIVCIVFMDTAISQQKKTFNTISTVRIGDQVWSTRNLDVSTFRNGDPIPQVQNNKEWKQAYINESPAWCYYDNDPANGKKYGKLYNWYAVTDERGLAPKGFHVPSKAEFDALVSYCGGEGTNAYNSLIPGGSSGFSSLLGGCRSYDGDFFGLTTYSDYWSASQVSDANAWALSIYSVSETAIVFYDYEGCGFSVRCVKD